jgi:carbon monoxide dehydrogenase subunit G
MDLNATYIFNAPVSQVWDLLMDVDAIGKCLPGCKGLRPLGDDRYEAELAVAVAAISGNFKGTVSLQDKVPPQSYKLALEGSGGPGFVKGHAAVTLAPEGEAKTSVQIAAHADAGGMLARVGQRLLEGVARMTMDRFYGCLAKRLEQPGVAGHGG